MGNQARGDSVSSHLPPTMMPQESPESGTGYKAENQAGIAVTSGHPIVHGEVIAMPPPEEDEQVYVFGFPVEGEQGERAAPVIETVLKIAAVAGGFVVISQITRYEVRKEEDYSTNERDDSFGTLFMNILIGLAVPACGYFGAKDRNRNLLTWFYGCSMCQACCGLMTVMVVGSIVAAGGSVTQREYVPDDPNNPHGSVHVEEKTEQIPMSVAWVALIIALIQVALSSVQFYYSGKLLEEEYFNGHGDLQQAPPTTLQTSVVPAHQARAMPPPDPWGQHGGMSGMAPGGTVVAQPYTGAPIAGGAVAVAHPPAYNDIEGQYAPQTVQPVA